MRQANRTLALTAVVALALSACSTDLASRTGAADTASGSSAVQATGSGRSGPDYDGMRNNNGNGEAGTTPMPGSLGATAGEQVQ